MRARIWLVPTVTDDEQLVVRPAAANRAAGWIFIALALVFGVAGFVPDDSEPSGRGAGTLMLLFALLLASVGISLVTAKATVIPSEMRYRYGLVRRRIQSSDIEKIFVGPCSGAFYPRVCLHVDVRKRARPIRLVALQRADSSKGRAALNRAAADMQRVLDTSLAPSRGAQAQS